MSRSQFMVKPFSLSLYPSLSLSHTHTHTTGPFVTQEKNVACYFYG